MRGFSFLAVLIGGVSDVLLSSVLGIGLTAYVIVARGLAQVPKNELQSTLVAAIHGTPALYAIQLVIGFGCSVLGGFIAASIAKQRKLLNGVLASWLCVGIGIFSQIPKFGVKALVIQVVLIALTPLCYLLGAYIKITMRRSPPASA
jgi:hypothetical protein